MLLFNSFAPLEDYSFPLLVKASDLYLYKWRSWSFNSGIDLWPTTLTVMKTIVFLKSSVRIRDIHAFCRALCIENVTWCFFFLHLRSKEIGIQQPDLLHARLTTAPSPRLLHKNKRNVKIYRMLHVHVTHCYIFF